ncbi:MAG TPA: hypothetical protein VHP33_30660 [Polyangiaceae bacterium]|nr:hypothetical protein [Polyangiaceae bacterium]
MSNSRRDGGQSDRPGVAIRLVDVLRVLPDRELESLIARLKIRTDEAKRIDVPSQVARMLLQLPEIRDTSLLPGPTRELLYRIAEAKGVLVASALPPAVEPLVARGIVFVRGAQRGVELLLPIAFMLQLRSWEGEDPRGVRALLSQVSQDVAGSIAGHYLGRPATPPMALALEPAWEVLTNAPKLARELEELAPLERKLLAAVDTVGGEVETDELLDLEREPLRLRGATGATPSRRGVGFALERRGYLVPIHPNRHIIPSEVATIVGATRRAERETQRHEIKNFVLADDHAPRRARFAEDPAALALAMALTVRDPSVELRTDIGTPRSLIGKLSTRFGKDQERVAFIAALSRAIGLWDPSAVSVASPPGSHEVGGLGKALFESWRRGGAWDEARPDGEVMRIAQGTREASAVGSVRDLVLEALQELGDGRWVPWEAIAGYVRSDSRAAGLARLIQRWAQRAGVEAATPAEIARRIAFESLHALGVVDIGDADSDEADSLGPTLRITPRGRAFLSDGVASAGPKSSSDLSRFTDNQALRIGPLTKTGHVLSLSPFVEVGAVTGTLDVLLTAQTLAAALGAGFEADVIQARIEQVASLPDPIARTLAQASAVIGRAEFVSTSGFLWVEDPEVRELLRTRRQTQDLFVDPSPPSGLLLVPGIDLERLARRCRSLGVEVVVEGEVYRTRSIPPGRGSGARRLESSNGMPALRSSRPPPRGVTPAPATVSRPAPSAGSGTRGPARRSPTPNPSSSGRTSAPTHPPANPIKRGS